MAFKETVTAVVVKNAIKYARKDFYKNAPRILSLMEMADVKKVNRSTYAGLHKVLDDPDNNWMRFARDLVCNTDEHVLNQLVQPLMNVAINSYTKRMAAIEKYGCNVPWAILMDPTAACNLKCTGCWAAEYGNRLNLTYEELDKLVTEGEELGIHWYMCTGGEPMCRKNDLLKLAAKHQSSVFHLFTNGTLIDDAFCEEVKKVGNMAFFLSVEGLDDATDSRRGEGVFQRVMNAMDIMKKHGLLFGTSICYTSANYKAVTSDEFMDMLISHGVRFNWYFHYMPIGDGANVDLMLNPEQREYMIQRVREIRGFTGGKQIFCIDFQNDGEYIDGCIAGGRQYAHINPNGDVEPCVFIHYSGANIHDKSLLECLQQPLFKEYHKGQPFNGNHLRPCPMLENPQILGDMVRRSGAHSTDMQQPESPEDVFRRCRPYATSWMPTADRLWAEKHPGYVDPENPESANSCASCASCAACSAHQE